MPSTIPLNLFISYSHLDEKSIDEFSKHIAPLKNNGFVDVWHDRKIVAGHDYQDDIDNNLGSADIICLFLSVNFLSSAACLKEKDDALRLQRKNGVSVVPIILSHCGWLDHKELSPKLALPTDGKPICGYQVSSEAWQIVYNGLKIVIEERRKLRNLKISNVFSSFLMSSEMLAKAHPNKEEVTLNDIFVYPDLEKFDEIRDYEKTESAEKLLADFCDYKKILIAGESQSGKTTLCKKTFVSLRERNLVPVYVVDKDREFLGKIGNRIEKAFSEQYDNADISDFRGKIVPIIDDFHYAKYKEKHIDDLSGYSNHVVIVDDVFDLNITGNGLIRSYSHFRIKELRPSLRSKLISSWTHLNDRMEGVKYSENEIYKQIDSTTEFVDVSLGKVIGSGLMPAYPFFILSVISASETFGKTLDQEISSQGHCYQALIYLYLKKVGVKNEEIDTYINFLTELSFFFYKSETTALSEQDFKEFVENYRLTYNMPVRLEVLLATLRKTQMIHLDGFGQYTFFYPYLYYFFVAKYISEHVVDCKKLIERISANLHKDENAYIAIFISHHSKNSDVLDEITLNAYGLFEAHKPSTLSKEEMSFLDKHVEMVVKEVLPPSDSTPEEERKKRLQELDDIESGDESNGDINDNSGRDDLEDELSLEIRRAIKTVEVMGRIIKSRAGSLHRERLEDIFEEGMKVHLRVLTSFFDIVRNEDDIVAYISESVARMLNKKQEKRREDDKKIYSPTSEEIQKLSRAVFWSTSFFVAYSIIKKIIHSLGSDKLTDVIAKICDQANTPVSYLVKHGILMWYNKHIDIDDIIKTLSEDKFPETAKKMMRFLVIEHCSVHALNFKEKQKVEIALDIAPHKLVRKP